MRPFKHYLAALIPVKKWRKRIRGQKDKKIIKEKNIVQSQLQNDIAFLKNQIQALANKEVQPPKIILINENDFADLKRRIQTVDNKISQLYKMVVLKEVAPDLLNHFKTDLFPIDDSTYEAYKTNLIYNPEMMSIRNKFAVEQEALISSLSHVENDVPYEKRCQSFEKLLSFNTSNKSTIYMQAIFNAFRQRDLDLVRSLCERMEQEPDAWQTMQNHSWLCYICLALLQKQEDKAVELLKKYVNHFRYLHIANYLPVAALTEKLGITDEKIVKSAVIFHAFDKAEKDKTFEKMIKGKRVAIVGNGPQELGTGNGKKIDSYDVVIRFNGGTKAGKEYAKDYGTKTTILARYQGAPFPSSSFPLLGHAEDIYFIFFWDKTLDDLYDYVQKGNKITFFSHKNEVFQLRINTPTTGIQYLWWVKHINPDFSMDDCYGFSFKDKEVKGKNPQDYYNPNENRSREPHDLKKEKKVILNLLKKG